MRSGAARYYMAALPSLGEPGSKPPITLGEFRRMMADQRWARVLVDAVLLLDDLVQRDSFLSGESMEVAPSVLTPAEARNEAPLPPELLSDQEDTDPGALEVDRLWSGYFHHVARLARAEGSRFLREWVAFEVDLRNALAVARAQRLGLSGDDYRVAAELGGSDEDFTRIVDEWAMADNPLSAYRVLIRTRWRWTVRHDGWFTFRADEVAAYAAKLLLLHQEQRLSSSEERMAARPAPRGEQQEDGNR